MSKTPALSEPIDPAVERARLLYYKPLSVQEMNWNNCQAVYPALIANSKHVRFHDMVKLEMDPVRAKELVNVFSDANTRLSQHYGFDVIKIHLPTLGSSVARLGEAIGNSKKENKPPRAYCIEVKNNGQSCTVFLPIDTLALALGKDIAQSVAKEIYAHHVDAEKKLDGTTVSLEPYDADRAEKRLEKLAMKHQGEDRFPDKRPRKKLKGPRQSIGQGIAPEAIANNPDFT